MRTQPRLDASAILRGLKLFQRSRLSYSSLSDACAQRQPADPILLLMSSPPIFRGAKARVELRQPLVRGDAAAVEG